MENDLISYEEAFDEQGGRDSKDEGVGLCSTQKELWMVIDSIPMAQPRAATIREAYATSSRGDIDGYLQPCAQDFAFHVPGHGGITGAFVGRQGRFVGIVILFCLLAQAATTFDLSADFSLRNNPNQVWQYGYSETNSLDPAQFRLDRSTGALGEIGFWHPSVSDRPGPGYYPYVAYNSAKQTRLGSSNGWAARAGEVAMEASNSGQYSLIRFVTSAPGIYKVTARFEGIHFGLSSTDVHVLHNATSLFDAEIEGYGGDPAFHEVQGVSPTTTYSGQIDLKANDTVTFACGYGKNKTNFSDTTGLFAQVVLLSEVGSGK